MSGPIVIVVGSKNPAKVQAVREVVEKVFPDRVRLYGFDAQSGVSHQPMSLKETREGSRNRARAALASSPDAKYGVGVEGGLQWIEGSGWFDLGWIVVVDRDGNLGEGHSGGIRIPDSVAQRLLMDRSLELGTVLDERTGDTKVKQKNGFMGLATNDQVTRGGAYAHGLHFAFAALVSEWIKE